MNWDKSKNAKKIQKVDWIAQDGSYVEVNRFDWKFCCLMCPLVLRRKQQWIHTIHMSAMVVAC